MVLCSKPTTIPPYLDAFPVNISAANLATRLRIKKKVNTAIKKLLIEIQNPVPVSNVCKVDSTIPVNSDMMKKPITAHKINRTKQRFSISFPTPLV